MKFRAKPIYDDQDWEAQPFLEDLIDEEGYIQGYYVDGYIVGEVIESTDEYITLSFWWPVDKESVEVI